MSQQADRIGTAVGADYKLACFGHIDLGVSD